MSESDRIFDIVSGSVLREGPPEIDMGRLYRYRTGRLREALERHDAAMVMLVNPVSLRYAADYRTYPLFQSHIPSTYLFVARDGPSIMHNGFGAQPGVDESRPGRSISFFDGAGEMAEQARLLAGDIVDYLDAIGSDNRRVMIEYVNPSVTQALLQRGLEVLDGVAAAEEARIIKSDDEIACMKWAVAVAEFGIGRMREALRPGVSELQLWGLLNYTNLANNGDWHEGRMLASGPRINPWLQEASPRTVEDGDLVGFDTDMVGPFGYFADISRTFHCGPSRPTRRQKELYRLAVEEVESNIELLKPGITLEELRDRAWPVPEEFRENAYSCVIHGVGMCDEYPQVKPAFRHNTVYDGTIEAGMVICVESYIGAVGETDGVKLEQQVLVTADGAEPLSTFPWEESLLD